MCSCLCLCSYELSSRLNCNQHLFSSCTALRAQTLRVAACRLLPHMPTDFRGVPQNQRQAVHRWSIRRSSNLRLANLRTAPPPESSYDLYCASVALARYCKFSAVNPTYRPHPFPCLVSIDICIDGAPSNSGAVAATTSGNESFFCSVCFVRFRGCLTD